MLSIKRLSANRNGRTEAQVTRSNVDPSRFEIIIRIVFEKEGKQIAREKTTVPTEPLLGNGVEHTLAKVPKVRRILDSPGFGGGIQDSPLKPRGDTMKHSPRWKADLCYYRETQALKFLSQQDYAGAAKLLWNELHDLPHDIVGNHTIIVPTEAVEYFAAKGLKFEQSRVLTPSELPGDELYELRKERGAF